MSTDRQAEDATPRADAALDREGGAWIGQHPDDNTERVRQQLDEGAERVAVTQNESGESARSDEWPGGHRGGEPAGDDDVRQAGENG